MQSLIPTGMCPAQIMIVNEAPSLQDLKDNMPFSGYSGAEFDRMLAEAKIQRSQCFITHVLRSYPPGGDPTSFIAQTKREITPQHTWFQGKPVLPALVQAVELLKVDVELCRPNVIVAVGNLSLWALTGEWGVTNWRSSVMGTSFLDSTGRKIKVIPIISPSTIMKIWSWRTITVQDLRRIKKESQFKEINRQNYNFLISPNYHDTISLLAHLHHKITQAPTLLACDIETRSAHMDCIGLAWSTEDAVCIPLMHTPKNLSYWSEEEEAEIVYYLYLILTHPNCKVIGHNFHYDSQYIYRYWHFNVNFHSDTMILQHSCFSSMLKSLAFISSMYSPTHLYWKDEGSTWSTPEEELERWTYNCKDCVKTFEMHLALSSVCRAMGLEKVNEFQQFLFHPVLETMQRGIRVNTEMRADFALTLFDEIAKREQFYIDILGQPLNPGSFPQMQRLFKDELGMKPIKDRKNGSETYNDEAMRKFGAREPLLLPLTKKIQEHRSLRVFLSTFVQAPLDVDQRMRCMFKIPGTDTYRFASTKNAFGTGMNLQNVSKGEEGEDLELPNVRAMLIPDPGYEFFDTDLDSADLRIVCWEAGIPEMKQMINEGLKVYVEVMKEYYHDPSLTKSSPQYGTFKSFCHGTNYLGTSKGLADRLGLTRHEVDKLQKWYFGKFPELLKWHQKIINQVNTKRMVENIFGYRMYFFDRIQGTIMNQAVAWIPQSTVACIINRAYVNIYKNLKEVQVLLQVHDSLAGQYPIQQAEWCRKRLLEECRVTLPYPDPTVVPVGIKMSRKSWGDCE